MKTVYKHEQLTELLRREIGSRDFSDRRFHTVKFLMEHYEVSQATLSRALQPLFQEGLLYSVSGKGTFVREAAGAPPTQEAIGLRSIYCIVSESEIFDPSANPENWFAAQQILKGIIDAGRELGYRVHVTPTRPAIEAFRALAAQPEAAFVFLEYQYFEQLIEHCLKNRVPCAVFAKHHRRSRAINQVWLDVELAQYRIVEYLIGKGHRDIGFLGDHENSHRLRGYRAALRDAGITFRRERCRFFSGSRADAQRYTRELLELFPEQTAICCSSDLRAVGAIAGVAAAGRPAPSLAITGMDNAWMYYDFPLSITTMDLRLAHAGRELTALVDGELHGQPVRTVAVEPVFKPGESA